MSERTPMIRSTVPHSACRSACRSACLRRRIVAALACAAGVASFAAAALPVIPLASGFGVDTPAGRGGAVIKVTNLNESGAGSLKACVDASGPRVCVFEVSGTIKSNKDLIIRNPKITIAGQTAPSPGVMYRGGALWVAASDVLVQHMRFRPGDDPAGPSPENRDALKIDSPKTPITNVVIDHCSFSWAIDETAQLWKGWDNVTLNNNIFAEGLRDSLSPVGAQGYGVLIGPWKGHASLSGNLLAHMWSRNPLTRASEMVFVNNVVYNRGNMGVDVQNQSGILTSNTVIGNVFIRGADHQDHHKQVVVRTSGSLAVSSQSKLFVSDNVSLGMNTADEWSIVSPYNGAVPVGIKAALPPSWPVGLTRLPTQSDVVLKEVLRYAGARPADRDPVDARIVKSVRDRTGRIINCVSANGTARCSKNAGGWPVLAANRRTLTPPSDPHAITASGYTKLEAWLHEMSAQVEGRSAKLPESPVLATKK